MSGALMQYLIGGAFIEPTASNYFLTDAKFLFIHKNSEKLFKNSENSELKMPTGQNSLAMATQTKNEQCGNQFQLQLIIRKKGLT